MTLKHEVLIIEDEKDICTLIEGILQDEGYATKVAHTSLDGLKLLYSRQPSLVILDVWLGQNDRDGLSILEEVKKFNPFLPVIMISGHSTIEKAVQAIKLGAYDFLEKPFQMDKLLLLVRKTLELNKLHAIAREKYAIDFKNVILQGESSYAHSLQEKVQSFENTDLKIVMIQGDKGCRKRYIADLIHENSKRSTFPLLHVDLQTIDVNDLDKILFGYEVRHDEVSLTLGLLEQAHLGSLYISEVALIPKNTQKKLLDFFLSQSFTRLGGDSLIYSNVQLIFGSTFDFQTLSQNQNLRDDFLSRVWVDPILSVPLTKRVEDIEKMMFYLFKKLNVNLAVHKNVLQAFFQYSWPANIHEFELVVESLVLRCKDKGCITLEDLPKDIINQNDQITLGWMDFDLKTARESFEREYILYHLKKHRGNISHMASDIGMERTALYRKIKVLNIQ